MRTSVAPSRGIRVKADTLARRFRWVVLVSALLHLLLTPLAGWMGLASSLLSQQESGPPPAEEELDAIPVELLEETPESASDRSGLPEQDPVEVIEELIAVPEEAVPPVAKPSSNKPEPTPDDKAEQARAERQRREEQERLEREQAERDEQRRQRERRAKELQKQRDKARQGADAGTPPASQSSSDKPPSREGSRPAIENPVAMVGEAGEVVKSNAKLQLVLYADKLRKHAVGRRVAEILPRLPQWKDFFGGTELDLVEDFDSLFVAGPSFYYSQHLFVAMEYNTQRSKVVAAVDRLVRRQGHWLKDAPVPAAIAVADRAERLFVVPKRKLVFVAPPRLKQQAFKLSDRGLPRSDGPEAFVALVKNPKKSFWQLGLDISETVHDAKIRLTPLEAGAVRVELSAQDDTEEGAQSTAHRVNRDINEKVEMLAGFSSVLSRFGFGGLGGGMKLPHIELRTKGSEIYGELVLNQQQVDFILDRVERYVVYMESQFEQAKRAAQRSANPASTGSSAATPTSEGRSANPPPGSASSSKPANQKKGPGSAPQRPQ